MWECEQLLDISCFFFLHLPSAARFVDRDMLMRFLGYGIGHKGQNNCVVSSDEAGDEGSPEEEDLDPPNTARITHNQNVPPPWNVVDQEATHDTQDGDDDRFARDSDSDSNTDSDDEDDLDGHL